MERAGVGYGIAPQPVRDRKAMFELIDNDHNETRHRTANEMTLQGLWHRWSQQDLQMHKVSWQAMIHNVSEQLLSFILESQTSTLACGSNLVRWMRFPTLAAVPFAHPCFFSSRECSCMKVSLAPLFRIFSWLVSKQVMLILSIWIV